jgi:hypothetical protein
MHPGCGAMMPNLIAESATMNKHDRLNHQANHWPKSLTDCCWLQRVTDFHNTGVFFAGFDGEAQACHELEHIVIVAQHLTLDH